MIRRHPKEPTRYISLIRWGLIPYWAGDPSISARMINARSESVADKPAFREPLQNRRCLIPADGFYEWKRSGSGKQPFCFEVGDGELFAFAGLGSLAGYGRQCGRKLHDSDYFTESAAEGRA